jgi:hypothetical protein
MKRHRFDLEPEEISVVVRAASKVRFEHDGERGDDMVRCKELPEVAAHGATLRRRWRLCAVSGREIELPEQVTAMRWRGYSSGIPALRRPGK